MKNGDRVVQMIPAAGYYAAYQDGDEITYNPVVAWIVVEDQQGRQRVDGVDPSGVNWDGSPTSSPVTSHGPKPPVCGKFLPGVNCEVWRCQSRILPSL